jgi:hypothetical protein
MLTDFFRGECGRPGGVFLSVSLSQQRESGNHANPHTLEGLC